MINYLVKIFIIIMLFSGETYASQIIIDNKSTYPQEVKNSKVAVQWAASASDMAYANHVISTKGSLEKRLLYRLTKQGKVNVTIPKNIQTFRILVWSHDNTTPDLLTNWVMIVPNKIYKLDNELLTPTILLNGAGC